MTATTVATNPGDDYFKELANTKISFPAATCELIDNAISASRRADGGSFFIALRVGRGSEHALNIGVADCGTGISPDDLVNQVFRPAGRAVQQPECYRGLREHGFGLKHALAWLTHQTGYRFRLITANRRKTGSVDYMRIDDTLRIGLKAEDTTVTEWNAATSAFAFPTRPLTGTVITFDVRFEQAARGWTDQFQRTVLSREPLETFVKLLREHLGATYRRFLTLRRRTSAIRILWDDSVAHTSGVEIVAAVQIPYLPGSRSSSLHGPGGLTATYTRGIVDPDVNTELFYRTREPLQGLDVTYNGKLIQTAWYPWEGVRNPEQNGFVGELLISGGKAPTLLTKNEFNWTDPGLSRLRQLVVQSDRVHRGPKNTGLRVPYNRVLDGTVQRIAGRSPKPAAGSGLIGVLQEYARKNGLTTVPVEDVSARGGISESTARYLRRVDKDIGGKLWLAPRRRPSAPITPTELREPQLRDAVFQVLQSAHPAANPVKEHLAWDPKKTGSYEVPTDLTFECGGKLVVIECKVGETAPKDVSQLLANMEGYLTTFCQSGIARAPSDVYGVLLADTFPPDVRFLMDYISGRPMSPRPIFPMTWRSLGTDRTTTIISPGAKAGVDRLVRKTLPKMIARWRRSHPP